MGVIYLLLLTAGSAAWSNHKTDLATMQDKNDLRSKKLT
jgi:hypothetical protein